MPLGGGSTGKGGGGGGGEHNGTAWDGSKYNSLLLCPEHTQTSPKITLSKVIVVPVLESVAVTLYSVSPPSVGGSFAIHVEFPIQNLSIVLIVFPRKETVILPALSFGMNPHTVASAGVI
jgi:hypothetical protein